MSGCLHIVFSDSDQFLIGYLESLIMFIEVKDGTSLLPKVSFDVKGKLFILNKNTLLGTELLYHV